MALLHESIVDKKFDVRMMDRNLQRAQLSPTEVEKFLKDLPDDSGNLEFVSQDDLEFQEKISRRP